jgi:hypothetical protein
MSNNYQPTQPDGISSRAELLRIIHEYIFKFLKIQGGPGVTVDRTTNGVKIGIDQNVIKATKKDSGGARWA